MRFAARHQTQSWPAIAASGQYLGSFLTRTPTKTALGRTSLGYLGQTTPVMTAAQIISEVNPKHAYPDDATMNEAITGLQLTPGYNTASECSAATGGGSKTGAIEAASGAAVMKIAAATGPAAPFVAIGGAILSLIGMIGAHHAAAVQNEQTILCQAVPATNAALAQVMQDVQSGTYSAAQGAQYLQQIQSAFNSAVQPITKSCNEACGLSKELAAIVIAMTQQLSTISVSSGGSALAASSSSSMAGIPTWALVAAAVFGFLMLSGE